MYGNNDWRDYLEHARSHKYIKKIKLGTHTRYFYTPSELKAYYEKQKKASNKEYNEDMKYYKEGYDFEKRVMKKRQDRERKRMGYKHRIEKWPDSSRTYDVYEYPPNGYVNVPKWVANEKKYKREDARLERRAKHSRNSIARRKAVNPVARTAKRAVSKPAGEFKEDATGIFKRVGGKKNTKKRKHKSNGVTRNIGRFKKRANKTLKKYRPRHVTKRETLSQEIEYRPVRQIVVR